MEINLQKLGSQAIESTTDGKKMRLSENAQSMVFQLFTKNVYSNPIGTVVREITSNCFDSHVEAKVKAPVIIRKTVDKQTNTIYISFIDYGVGMSPDRVENIYGVYFESTKRVDNTQIGGFGIGGKTPLAYKRSTGMGEGEYDNSFYVITNFDGICYYYLIYEGADTPVISLLHSEPTIEHNGTEVRIPILSKDINTFANEMARQLYYFEDIIFEGFEDTYKASTLTNDYQIIRGNSFLFRGTDYSNDIHICLGRVAYPIDYSVLGLSSSDYRLPIALKLEVGDIGVTVSRESLDYSEATIKLLKSKLIIAKAEIIELISKQYENIVTLEDYFSVKNDFGQLKFNNGTTMYVGNLIKKSDIDFSNFKYSFTKFPNDQQLFNFFFDVKIYGKKPSRSRYSKHSSFEGGYSELKSKTNLYSIEGVFNRKVLKQAYLKSKHDTYYIISKRNIVDNSVKSEICELFNVHITDMSILNSDGTITINPYVNTLFDMQDEYFTIVQKYAKDYDDLEVPDDFVVSRKKRDCLSDEIRKSTIPIKIVNHYQKYRVVLDLLLKHEMPIFYGTKENEYELSTASNLYDLLFDKKHRVTGVNYSGNNFNYHNRSNSGNTKGSIMFILLSASNIKYMKYCKNAYHIDQFYLKMLYRKEDFVQQYFQTYNIIEKYNSLDDLYKYEDFVKVNAKLGLKIKRMNRLINAIPEKAKDNNIGNYRLQLSKFFNIKETVLDKDQQIILDTINELKTFRKNNADILSYINMPYRAVSISDALADILKKVLIF